MEGFELFGHMVELPAPDVGAQAGRQEGQIVQRDGNGNAIRRRRHADFVVGGRHLQREPDDLPGCGQPLHNQRKRVRQQQRRLQRGYVERGDHRDYLRLAEHPEVIHPRVAAAFPIEAGLETLDVVQHIL